MTMPVTGRVESLVGGGCPSARNHTGIDITSPLGTDADIHAAYPGVAHVIDEGDGYGLHIDVDHLYFGGRYTTRYAHLSRALVAEGETVAQGQVIAKMGSSGASVVHLHFEVLGSDGAYIDTNAAFRPCRREVTAGDPIAIDFAPLTSPREILEELAVALGGSELGAAPLNARR